MTTIKQVCLGVAIAGAVVGAGSAVGTAVAYADLPGPDSTSSSAPGPQPQASSRAHSAKAGAIRGESSARKSSDRRAVPAAQGATPVPRAAAARTRTITLSADPLPANVVADLQPAASAWTPSPTAPQATPLAADAVPALAPLPALPRPALIPLFPLLPTPAVPVAPAGAATVSATGTSLRSRTASVVAAQLGDPPTHVLLIGTDGTNLDKILSDPYYNTGGFKIVMDQGVTGATSIVGHTTISGPSWTTILTGVWDNKSGVINNLFNPAPYDAWPTVFNLIEYNKPAVNTAVIADWKYINDIGGAGGWKADQNTYVPFTNSWADTDAQVVADTINLITNTQVGSSSFVFSYQVQVDEAGHAYGGGSPQYAQAVTNVSNNIDAIMTAVNTWNTAHSTEQWTVIVTTDHGHQQSVGFGHGFQSPNETSSFVIFDLAGDNTNDGKQNLAYTTADITPTIVDLFGIAQRSDFDGVPLTTKGNSIVSPTNLAQALNDAVDMYGYPNIGTDVALGVRTVFATVPYLLDGLVTNITTQLQGIVNQNIFLVSAVAGIANALVKITGDAAIAVTQAIARVVARLTGSGTIAPTDPPLPAPPTGSLSPAQLLLLPTAALV